MNTRTRALVASAAVVGALLAGGSVALATPDDVQPSCSEAIRAFNQAVKADNPATLTALVTVAETELTAAKAGTDAAAIVAAEAKLAAAKAKLADYQGKVEAAKAAADKACQGPAGEPGKDGEDGKDGVPTFVADKDCKDFPDQAAAQAFFDAHKPGDPHNLDADGDGVPCEVDQGSEGDGQVDVVPSTDDGVETGGL